MKREYHRWFSPAVAREMELLVFGHSGTPALVFPTSCGRFYDFEDQGMVAAIAGRIEEGGVQLFCVDSIDSESWYNRAATSRWRLGRHVQYERYLLDEVLHFIHQQNGVAGLSAIGCSFGGYHAVNLALRHPEIVTSVLSMGGAFDLSGFLHGYQGQDAYFLLPFLYLPNLTDPWYLNRLRRNRFVLATGTFDPYRGQNERLTHLMRGKDIPVRYDVWGDGAGHDWSWWQKMLQTCL